MSNQRVKQRPDELKNPEYRYDSFGNQKTLLNKKKGHLPAMGWNSWNAFGSGNTEALTKAMADAMVELELDKLGYQYVVLDDGCYKPVRENERIANEPTKFPSGFKALGDYIHEKGLKFGMYNDIGTNLCAGAEVGTCGYEDLDAQSYVDWGVDFLKVDNCYYLWDNATFSDAENAKYVYAPAIKGIEIKGEGFEKAYSAVNDGVLRGVGMEKTEDCVSGIGTYDGTGPEHTPVGEMSGELCFAVTVPKDGEYAVVVEYASGVQVGIGSWLQIAVGENAKELAYDDFVSATENTTDFAKNLTVTLSLKEGENWVRLMNHRRQENTLCSYAALLEGLNKANSNHDIIFSICEWGKTQPQNWGYKVGDSWRILNDITFRVGSDGDAGYGTWTDSYTPSVTSQYNKAVIMDEFAGPDKGWNDPDMLMVGMDGLTETMYQTHMAMWCMMNAPLMLGLDLRRVKKGDALWNIIANKDLIALNQDTLGVQAKRIYCSLAESEPDTTYVRDNQRVDVLAKPLADGGVALSFVNVSEDEAQNGTCQVKVNDIVEYIGRKMVNAQAFAAAKSYTVTDLWTKETCVNENGVFEAKELMPCENKTYKVMPNV